MLSQLTALITNEFNNFLWEPLLYNIESTTTFNKTVKLIEYFENWLLRASF